MDINSFEALGISSQLVKSLIKQGIKEPTPIQAKAIPYLLEGKDVIAQAQTGTGKTFAFMLPMMEKVNPDFPFIQGLVITPTRELALQIKNEADKLARGRGVSVLSVYGGQDVEAQIRKLKRKAHIVIGTPGRLIDHLRRGTLNFCKLNTLVLDEADQMLDMGFLPDVETIIGNITAPHQTLLFSATMPKAVKALAKKLMVDPVTVQAKGKEITLDEIKQLVVETTDRQKQASLFKVIDETEPFLAIAFCRTKRRASTLNAALLNRGYNSDELHGDLSQAKRERVMESFRKAKIQILVATDVAARGLDVEGVTHIFNYDIPQDLEGYIHRIGRTGRAGERGVAITFAALKDKDALRKIEEGINRQLERYPLRMELDLEKPQENSKDKSKDYGKSNHRGKSKDFGGGNKSKGKDYKGKDYKGKGRYQDKDGEKDKGKSFGKNRFNDSSNKKNDRNKFNDFDNKKGDSRKSDNRKNDNRKNDNRKNDTRNKFNDLKKNDNRSNRKNDGGNRKKS